jgi:hypothetical protein
MPAPGMKSSAAISRDVAPVQIALLDVSEPEPSIELMQSANRPLLVVSLGVGRDSVALLILLWKLGIRPDLILFADAGGEKAETYAYIPVLNRWLARVGFPEITILRRRQTRKQDQTLAAQMLRLGTLPSIAFQKGACSQTWKQVVQQVYVRAWTPAQESWNHNRRVVFAIGFEADECDRVERANTYAAAKPNRFFRNWFPLVEAKLTLDGCIDLIKSVGLGVPPKSSCTFCPSSKVHEIVWLSEHEPGSFLRALVMEARALPGLKTIKGLGGRAFRWRDLDCATAYVAVADQIAGDMPPPERDRAAAPSARLKAAIARVLAIDDEQARNFVALSNN